MPNFICTTCGMQYAESNQPPAACDICEDERQYTKVTGQQMDNLHFDGGTVLHWQSGADGKGALLTGDIIQVVPDRKHVSFMYSYPNHIPLSGAAVKRIVDAVEPYKYDRVYGAFWGMVIEEGGMAAVRRSAERYLNAVG